MASCREDMQGGLNTFIRQQAEMDGRAEITLADFDTEYQLVWPIRSLSESMQYTLVPRGGTALLDAMGRFITDVGTQLRKRHESRRPGKVIICVVTDGQENSSREWTRASVRRLVSNQREQWQWEIVFLGANMDAVAEAASFGIPRGSSITYTTANAGDTYGALNNYVTSTRSGLIGEFSEAERSAAVK